MNVLLTGGTGYVASHTAVALSNEGHKVILYDNLSNSNIAVASKLKNLANRKIKFVKGDIRDGRLLFRMLKRNKIEAVMHFAGLKSVAESVEQPLDYFDNNVLGTITLLRSMHEAGVRILVFSSSATVYGDPKYLPIDERHPLSAVNPYGRTKLHIEELLQDVVAANTDWRVICLRYFNPVGSHHSGLIGEDPLGPPNNLMPYMVQVAAGRLPYLRIFGNDYSTADGTGVRDYVHVMDLAEGHSAGLKFLEEKEGFHAINLGTGKGHSVLELVRVFEEATGRDIPRKVVERRFGDVAESYASIEKAGSELGWRAKRSLLEMCSSAWLFQKDKVV
tara:strand:+ start:1288 stop:2289 length:1002 start_codon:yes stop_codon:yes gene_type:complete